MKRALTLALASLVLAGASGCSPARDDASDAASAMQAAVQQALTGKDPAPIVALFTDSAVGHAPNGTLTVGKAAIAERIAGQFPRVKGYQIGPRAFESSGDLAYGNATFKITLDPGPNGDAAELVGFMVVVMKRQPDRSWKLIDVGSWIGEADTGMDHDMPGMDHSMPGM